MFNVGDKVEVTYMNPKYKGSSAWEDLGKIGEITAIQDELDPWPIRVKLDDYAVGFSEDELTLFPLIKIGQQLLFEFMV